MTVTPTPSPDAVTMPAGAIDDLIDAMDRLLESASVDDQTYSLVETRRMVSVRRAVHRIEQWSRPHRHPPLTGPDLRAIRQRAGLSVADFARRMSVHPVTVYRWEEGATRINHRVARWARHICQQATKERDAGGEHDQASAADTISHLASGVHQPAAAKRA